MGKMEFSKKMLLLLTAVSVSLCVYTAWGSYHGVDVTAVAVLAGTSLVADGTWGGFYLWKAKNENRAKYAQRFIKQLADKYGADIALRAAEIVLKD